MHSCFRSQVQYLAACRQDSYLCKFINAIGVGFDAYVAYLNQTRKKLTGALSYIVAVFEALRSLTPLNVNFQYGKEEKHGKYLLMTIGNGKTSGGGFFLNPDAEPDDRILNLTTVDFTTRLEIVKNLPFALVNKLKNVDKAKFYASDTFNIELDVPYFVHFDGEIVSRNAKDLSINLEENKLRIIAES